MIKIYHNPRCAKSRQGLKLLENSGQSFGIIKYLNEPLSKNNLEEIINLLGIKPIALVRKNEAIWKSDYKGQSLTGTEIVQAMVKHPKLIERPVVVNGTKAIIGRPPENILSII